MAGHEVVDFATLTRHAFASSLKIKVTWLKNNVGEEFKKLNHGLVTRHSHHAMEHV